MIQRKSPTEVWDSISLDLISSLVEGAIVYINAAGAQMLGASAPGQLIGKPILDFVHPDYRNIAVVRVRQVSMGGSVECPSYERWVRLDGTVIDVYVAAVDIVNNHHPAVQLMVQERDSRTPYSLARHWHRRRRLRRKDH